jgi:hypothetical protein
MKTLKNCLTFNIKGNNMNSVKLLALVAALFTSQSAMATVYDLGNMGPPGVVSQDSEDLSGTANFLDYFTFTLDSSAKLFGSAPDVIVSITKADGVFIDITSIKLYAGEIGSGSLVGGDQLYSAEAFSFKNIAAGSYYLAVEGTDRLPLNDVAQIYTLGVAATAAPATAVPEPEAYAMMLAGLGLIGFAARRRQA